MTIISEGWNPLEKSSIAGYLRDLPVQDYERVRKGQVLAQLVDDDYRAAVAQAEASIESATAQARP